jgi:hypothetical protein
LASFTIISTEPVKPDPEWQPEQFPELPGLPVRLPPGPEEFEEKMMQSADKLMVTKVIFSNFICDVQLISTNLDAMFIFFEIFDKI